MKKEGESGRRKINQYTRYLTVVLATGAVATAWRTAFRAWRAPTGAGAVINPGIFFLATTVITLVGGTMFLMWLGEQITARGIGNGISLIIFAGIVAELPSALARCSESCAPALSTRFSCFCCDGGAVVIITSSCSWRARSAGSSCSIPSVRSATGCSAAKAPICRSSSNTSGVIPPIFASLAAAASADGRRVFGPGRGPEWVQTLITLVPRPAALYRFVSRADRVLRFFYTAIVFNPVETADNLKKYGGFIPGIRPGKNTAEYLDYVLTRLTVVGAAYLSVVCLLPEILISQYAVPFYFGGTSLLIVVTVTMDTVAQIHSHLLAHQYEGLIKKAKLRGRRG